MSKILGILKMAGLTLALCGGTICNVIGIPLVVAGINKQKDVYSTFENSEQYQLVKQAEEVRVQQVEERLEELEESFLNNEIPAIEYEYLKESYMKYINKDEEEFIKETFDKYATDESKGILKSGKTMECAGSILAGVGIVALFIKGFSFAYGSLTLGEPYEFVEKMEDVIAYDFAPSAKTIAKRKAEQEEKERLIEEEKRLE